MKHITGLLVGLLLALPALALAQEDEEVILEVPEGWVEVEVETQEAFVYVPEDFIVEDVTDRVNLPAVAMVSSEEALDVLGADGTAMPEGQVGVLSFFLTPEMQELFLNVSDNIDLMETGSLEELTTALVDVLFAQDEVEIAEVNIAQNEFLGIDIAVFGWEEQGRVLGNYWLYYYDENVINVSVLFTDTVDTFLDNGQLLGTMTLLYAYMGDWETMNKLWDEAFMSSAASEDDAESDE
ncbi:MAG: hypothetical protein ACLFTK_16610 [Anaerolineales bacterium]